MLCISLIIQIPQTLHRKNPNPLLLSATYPQSTCQSLPFPPKLTIQTLTLTLNPQIHVPCLERTIYGAKPGIDNETPLTIFPLSFLPTANPLEIPIPIFPSTGPGVSGDGALEFPLFPNAEENEQLAALEPDFMTFRVMRKYVVQVKGEGEVRFGEGVEGKKFVFETKEYPVVVPAGVGRKPEVETDESGKEGGGEKKAQRKG